MITSFINRLLGKTRKASATPFGKREDVPVAVHGIDPSLVDGRALDVLHTLKRAGHEAYIVGGAVRDLLLGLRPKDFDVATSATPEQVKSLFRRAFIIGRRFRIVHVVFGRGREHEVIEVSTLRAYLDSADAEQISGNERSQKAALVGVGHAVDASGRVLRDNVWGTLEQDAARRDFSVNALYYDPETEVVVDFHHGIRDAKKRVLRLIGDPATRYREDPVRIIRAVRFAAKLSGLGFHFDSKTRAPLRPSLPLLAEVPPSRLFDEMLKLLQTGHALASLEQLQALGLGQGIYPLLDVVVERAHDPFVRAALQDTDRRVAEEKSVVPSFLLACVLWSDVREGWGRRQQAGSSPFAALQEAVDEAFEARIGDVSGRGKLAADMREIWLMQPRFDKRSGQAPFALVEQPRFRAGFDFLRLRAQVGEIDEELSHWWETFSLANEAVRRDMLEALRLEQQRNRAPAKGPGRAKTPRAPRSAAGHPGEARPELDPHRPELGEAEHGAAVGSEGGAADAAPARKRRRRRKPAGGGAGAGAGAGGEGGGGGGGGGGARAADSSAD